ncbi:MAG: hypothetical protein MK066_04870 [Crocinitomicaceae bacterium]|nr:hypothetical protein [Crocinitomicaceae bacterium]
MNYDLFLETVDSKYKEAFVLTRDLILNSHPAITIVTKYGYPFFVLKKNLFYVGVQNSQPFIGVCYAYKMPNILSLLDMTGRTRIGHFSLKDLNQTRYEELVAIVDATIAHDLNTNK